MKHLTLLFSLCVLVQIINAQSLPIALDGKFSDWTGVSTVFIDNLGDGAAFDFASFSVSNDSTYLYIKLSLSNEIQLNSGNSLFLEIDADNNSSTGYLVNEIGAELGWKLGGRYGYFNYGSSSTYIEHADIEFYALPTVTSSDFEMAIRRDVLPDNSNPLFTSDTIKICFVDQSTNGDYMPNQGQTFTYILDNSPVQAYSPIDIQKDDTSHIRLLTYNTLFNGISDVQRQASFQRIIQALNPDVITFNECWDVQWYDAQNLLDAWLPLPGGNSWNCWKIDGANITCTRYPVIQNWRILSDRRLTATLIDLPVEYQYNLMVINAHFKCCDGDSIRQREADGFINFIRDMKTPGGLVDVPYGTPFVLSGDLNLVGESQQLSTLLEGEIMDTAQFGSPIAPDWDNTYLNDVISYLADKRMAFTWQDNGSNYWPGRLDFCIASEYDFQVEKAFTLHTGIMSTTRLVQYGLQQSDTETASDHLPKVTDFSMPLILESSEIEEAKPEIIISPNPASEFVILEFLNFPKGKVSIQIFDVLGNSTKLKRKEYISTQNQQIKIPLAILKPGSYFFSIQSNEIRFVKTIQVIEK